MIREAILPDSEFMADILVRAWCTAYAGLIDSRYPETMERGRYGDIFKYNIEHGTEMIFVYMQDGKVRGFVSGHFRKDWYDCEIKGLYVDPDFQGRGMGGELMGTMLNFFREHRCRRMVVWTLNGAKNNAFYAHHGGIVRENKELDIGGSSYPGVGFLFELTMEKFLKRQVQEM
ncbi:MAG: GNAT family N-acetyltransferase [Spirochaetae bacterium HGW-Spirochaetae-1]|jgi:GNAT superfamily N-acetyltransferase|nr:MAG: GNAT family N-acetyltransferase [Spirochaetae bacterium HGW-Spirochaetae-1]